MVFSSIRFILLFLAVYIIYWNIDSKYKKYFVLLINILFILTFGISDLLSVIAVSIFSFYLAKKISHSNFLFVISVIVVLSPLIFSKYQIYLDFDIPFLSNKQFLPIGLSYYTFEALSYIFDIYRNKRNPEKNFVNYFIYLSFFPTITSGPIERSNFIKQINDKKEYSYVDSMYNLKLFMWGLFKKIIIADNLSIFVNNGYKSLHQVNGFSLILITVFYSIQLYGDFSGYSDMARGVAGMLGFNVRKNFDNPYLSNTMKEFWSKWHISLSSWLKDYVYITLGGNRKGKMRKSINLLITFVISGIWHGSKLTFIAWGGVTRINTNFRGFILD